MEAEISIWRKTGHFYFALTSDTSGTVSPCSLLLSRRKSIFKQTLGSRARYCEMDCDHV
jgi:hypothetical protein